MAFFSAAERVSIEKLLTTRSLAFSPDSEQRSQFRSMISAVLVESPFGITKPQSPITSGSEPASDTIGVQPQDMASATATPNPSCLES